MKENAGIVFCLKAKSLDFFHSWFAVKNEGVFDAKDRGKKEKKKEEKKEKDSTLEIPSNFLNS